MQLASSVASGHGDLREHGRGQERCWEGKEEGHSKETWAPAGPWTPV